MANVFMANVFTPGIATDVEAQKRVRKWIRALRSGVYPQGRNALKTYAGFCCLGVICQINDPNGWAARDSHTLSDGSPSVLGSKGRRLYRLSSVGQNTLANLNDEGQTFKQIAARLSADLRARLAA